MQNVKVRMLPISIELAVIAFCSVNMTDNYDAISLFETVALTEGLWDEVSCAASFDDADW